MCTRENLISQEVSHNHADDDEVIDKFPAKFQLKIAFLSTSVCCLMMSGDEETFLKNSQNLHVREIKLEYFLLHLRIIIIPAAMMIR